VLAEDRLAFVSSGDSSTYKSTIRLARSNVVTSSCFEFRHITAMGA
jgi:hypothetical protein